MNIILTNVRLLAVAEYACLTMEGVLVSSCAVIVINTVVVRSQM